MSTSTECSKILPETAYFINPRVPYGLAAAVEGLTREVLRHLPDDIYVFAAHHFENLLKLREHCDREKADTPYRDASWTKFDSRKHEASIDPQLWRTTRRSRSTKDTVNRSGWSFNETYKVLRRHKATFGSSCGDEFDGLDMSACASKNNSEAFVELSSVGTSKPERVGAGLSNSSKHRTMVGAATTQQPPKIISYGKTPATLSKDLLAKDIKQKLRKNKFCGTKTRSVDGIDGNIENMSRKQLEIDVDVFEPGKNKHKEAFHQEYKRNARRKKKSAEKMQQADRSAEEQIEVKHKRRSTNDGKTEHERLTYQLQTPKVTPHIQGESKLFNGKKLHRSLSVDRIKEYMASTFEAILQLENIPSQVTVPMMKTRLEQSKSADVVQHTKEPFKEIVNHAEATFINQNNSSSEICNQVNEGRTKGKNKEELQREKLRELKSNNSETVQEYTSTGEEKNIEEIISSADENQSKLKESQEMNKESNGSKNNLKTGEKQSEDSYVKSKQDNGTVNDQNVHNKEITKIDEVLETNMSDGSYKNVSLPAVRPLSSGYNKGLQRNETNTLTLPPISSEAPRAIKRKDDLILPALGKNAGHYSPESIEPQLEIVEVSEYTENQPDMIMTMQNDNLIILPEDNLLEAENVHISDGAQSDEEVQIIQIDSGGQSPRDIKDTQEEHQREIVIEEIFNDSLNVTPDHENIPQRPDSLEPEDVENTMTFKKDELKNKLIEIEVAEKNIEKVLRSQLDTAANETAVVSSKPNKLLEFTSQPVEEYWKIDDANVITVIQTPVEDIPSARTRVKEHTAANGDSKGSKETSVPAHRKDTSAKISGSAEVTDDVEEIKITQESSSNGKKSGQYSRFASTLQNEIPYSYILTEGSPCEIPESVTTVVIPDRSSYSPVIEDYDENLEGISPIQHPSAEDSQTSPIDEKPGDGEPSTDQSFDKQEIRNAMQVFGEYVHPQIDRPLGDVDFIRGINTIHDTMTAHHDLDKIKEEEEDKEEEEETNEDPGLQKLPLEAHVTDNTAKEIILQRVGTVVNMENISEETDPISSPKHVASSTDLSLDLKEGTSEAPQELVSSLDMKEETPKKPQESVNLLDLREETSEGPQEPVSSLDMKEGTSEGIQEPASPLDLKEHISEEPQEPISSLDMKGKTSENPQEPISPLDLKEETSEEPQEPVSPLNFKQEISEEPQEPISSLDMKEETSNASRELVSPLDLEEKTSEEPQELTSPLDLKEHISEEPQEPISSLDMKGKTSENPQEPISPLDLKEETSEEPQEPVSPLNFKQEISEEPQEPISSLDMKEETSNASRELVSPLDLEEKTSEEPQELISPLHLKDKTSEEPQEPISSLDLKEETSEGAQEPVSPLDLKEGTSEGAQEPVSFPDNSLEGGESGEITSTESSNEIKETTVSDRSTDSVTLDVLRPIVPELNLDSLQDITISSFKNDETNATERSEKMRASLRDTDTGSSFLETSTSNEKLRDEERPTDVEARVDVLEEDVKSLEPAVASEECSLDVSGIVTIPMSPGAEILDVVRSTEDISENRLVDIEVKSSESLTQDKSARSDNDDVLPEIETVNIKMKSPENLTNDKFVVSDNEDVVPEKKTVDTEGKSSESLIHDKSAISDNEDVAEKQILDIEVKADEFLTHDKSVVADPKDIIPEKETVVAEIKSSESATGDKSAVLDTEDTPQEKEAVVVEVKPSESPSNDESVISDIQGVIPEKQIVEIEMKISESPTNDQSGTSNTEDIIPEKKIVEVEIKSSESSTNDKYDVNSIESSKPCEPRKEEDLNLEEQIARELIEIDRLESERKMRQEEGVQQDSQDSAGTNELEISETSKNLECEVKLKTDAEENKVECEMNDTKEVIVDVQDRIVTQDTQNMSSVEISLPEEKLSKDMQGDNSHSTDISMINQEGNKPVDEQVTVLNLSMAHIEHEILMQDDPDYSPGCIITEIDSPSELDLIQKPQEILEEAATKIQACVRGFLTRKELRSTDHPFHKIVLQNEKQVTEREKLNLRDPQETMPRKRFQREDAIREMTSSLEDAFMRSGLQHTGEFHDCLPLPLFEMAAMTSKCDATNIIKSKEISKKKNMQVSEDNCAPKPNEHSPTTDQSGPSEDFAIHGYEFDAKNDEYHTKMQHSDINILLQPSLAEVFHLFQHPIQKSEPCAEASAWIDPPSVSDIDCALEILAASNNSASDTVPQEQNSKSKFKGATDAISDLTNFLSSLNRTTTIGSTFPPMFSINRICEPLILSKPTTGVIIEDITYMHEESDVQSPAHEKSSDPIALEAHDSKETQNISVDSNIPNSFRFTQDLERKHKPVKLKRPLTAESGLIHSQVADKISLSDISSIQNNEDKENKLSATDKWFSPRVPISNLVNARSCPDISIVGENIKRKQEGENVVVSDHFTL